ncbi:hypothetical protein [Sporosarcina limicola]|uniref:Uncharacterized protein n=1 Tax=Sporosarcina limicola TaxID=34101 RepID=A0A927R4I2_9BACL|nr:hypothetical protein [Sporosarcina limicola]MBE1556231.1 hypothetical protein [Sporosarcina limicola]
MDELELEEDEQIGKFDFIVTKAEEFKNDSANILPIGADIYSVKDRADILIVKYESEIKRYLLLSEG